MKRISKANKLAILHGMRARLARPRGWIRGNFSREVNHKDGTTTTGFCLAGAANDAAQELGIQCSNSYEEVVTELSIETLARARMAARGQKYSDATVSTYVFNDSPDTKKKDVLALIDEKIAELS